jgi:Mrp family chromosome partitioning ATPase
VADALILSHSADAVLLILKFAQTRREMLKRSVEQLVTVGAPFMGCVLNDVEPDAPGYAYSYYYYRGTYGEEHMDGEDGASVSRLAS